MAIQNPTKKHHEAALLVAEDALTDEQIAETVGVHRTTLAVWKKDPTFSALVGDQVGRLNAAMLKLPIAKKRERLRTLDALHNKALDVIAERAATMADEAPGTSTGLMVRQTKIQSSGDGVTIVKEYSVDTALIREIRALEEQAAKELGQWAERHEVTADVRTVAIHEIRVPKPEAIES